MIIDKKKTIKAVFLIFTAFMTVINLVACSGANTNKGYNKDGYSYIKISNNQIAVGEITCLTKNKTVYVPYSIDGKRVVQLGYNSGLGFGGSGLYNNSFYQDNELVTVSRYYCPNTINDVFDGYMRQTNHLKVFYCGAIIDLKLFGFTDLCNEIYVPHNKFEEFNEMNTGCLAEIKRANVSFMLDEYTFYYVDYYETGSIIKFIPPNPDKTNYTFAGWYKDSSFTNKWDFETDNIQNDEKETKLYPYWIKNN